MPLVGKYQSFKMFKARVVMPRCYWLVGIFLIYVNSVESQKKNTITGRPVLIAEVDMSREFMRYTDTLVPIHDRFEYPNVIVAINKRNSIFGGIREDSQVIAPGVYINKNHVLTSFTPFRRLAWMERYRDVSEFYITHYKAKWLDDKNVPKGYLLESVNVTCGRQIFPNSSIDVRSDKFEHAPSYDLMVFKTQVDLEFLDRKTAYGFVDRKNRNNYYVIGPQLASLATAETLIGDTLVYVSLGMIDYDHVYFRNHLHTVKLHTNDRLIEDCDEWFDEVNTFICIKNEEEHIAIGSGALMFHEGAIIAIGSFTIQKGKESVHAFTDVRLLGDLIFSTCTDFDGFPDDTTTTPAPKLFG